MIVIKKPVDIPNSRWDPAKSIRSVELSGAAQVRRWNLQRGSRWGIQGGFPEGMLWRSCQEGVAAVRQLWVWNLSLGMDWVLNRINKIKSHLRETTEHHRQKSVMFSEEATPQLSCRFPQPLSHHILPQGVQTLLWEAHRMLLELGFQKAKHDCPGPWHHQSRSFSSCVPMSHKTFSHSYNSKVCRVRDHQVCHSWFLTWKQQWTSAYSELSFLLPK